MFGHHDDHSQQDTSTVPDETTFKAVDPEDRPAGQPAPKPVAADLASAAVAEPVSPAQKPVDTPAPAADQAWQHPGVPLSDDQEQIKDIISPAGGFPKRPSFQHSAFSDSGDNAPDAADSELIEVRQKALGDLAPIIDKLDLPPEEKFRTIMMMIQASDDESMVKAAYAAAHSIEDEKVRAQALLDIVNEVNYFTQPLEAES